MMMGLFRSYILLEGCILLTILSNDVYSELPPWVYEEWKTAAQEVLSVQATEVESLGIRTVNECMEEEEFLVTALVLTVIKTSAMIDQGGTIEFKTYDVDFDPAPECVGWSGPSWPQSVDVGWCGTVYLNLTNSSTLSLAAGGESLETMPCSSSPRAPMISEGLLSIVYGLVLVFWIWR
jgi:hypothetical protein